MIGFIVSALALIPLGRYLSFMGGFQYRPNLSLIEVGRGFTGIFLGVALVEEILFRSLIQNWLTQKFGESNLTLLAASMIFGFSHINNYSKFADGQINGYPPNWKYVLLATVAGFIYGKVFQKTNSVCCSAVLHASVNTVRRYFLG